MTKAVYALTPLTAASILAPASAPAASPIPAQGRRRLADQARLLRHPREPHLRPDPRRPRRGNGDPDLCLFGEEVTPNAHALAREFVVFDNFYVDAEVSYDGHAFSTGAYATDFVEKIWPTNYGSRGGRYLSEGGGKMRNAYGNVAAPLNGYIWDVVQARRRERAQLRRVRQPRRRTGGRTATPARARSSRRCPGSRGASTPTIRPYDLSIPDAKRVDIWLEEFRQFEQNGQLPRLNIIRLGNDHTAGTRAGYPTPRAMVAENDVALGRLVEAITQEPVLEGLRDLRARGRRAERAGPRGRAPLARVRRSARSSGAARWTARSTRRPGMLRTMELILGLPPMSQLDAAATPMYNAFQATPVADALHRPAGAVSTSRRRTP